MAPQPLAALLSAAIREGARPLQAKTFQSGNATWDGPTILADAHPQMELLQRDVFWPVLALVPVASMDEAMDADRLCPYRLGAAVFGEHREAHAFAARVDAGCVVINDMIAPTADPRVPFGGRGQSGFGVTRGALGLEEMTQLKTVIHQRSRWLPHLDNPTPADAQILRGFLGIAHGRGYGARWKGLSQVLAAVMEQRKWNSMQASKGTDDDA